MADSYFLKNIKQYIVKRVFVIFLLQIVFRSSQKFMMTPHLHQHLDLQPRHLFLNCQQSHLPLSISNHHHNLAGIHKY
jgi:hypothetical protein